MEWPMQKRLLYTELMSGYRRKQQEYQQAAQQVGDDADPAQAAQQAQAQAQQAHAAGGGGEPAAANPNIPKGVDPSKVPTPDGVENPYAQDDSPDDIDGDRITRRQPTEAEQQQRQQVDMRKVHPAVRKHGNVVQVRGESDDDDDADDAEA